MRHNMPIKAKLSEREYKKMKDEEIIKQLLNGNHLEPKELNRANVLNHLINIEIQTRLNHTEENIKK